MSVYVCLRLPEHIEVGVQSDTLERSWSGVSTRTLIPWHQPKAATSRKRLLLYYNPLLFTKPF